MPVRAKQYSLVVFSPAKISWLLFLPLFALFVLALPDSTWQTVLITQVVLLPMTFFFFLPGDLERRMRWTLVAVAALGLLCASYLAYNWYTESTVQCSTDGCAIAQSSSYATLFFGIPTSTVGVIGYTLVLLSLLLWSRPGGELLTAALGAFGLAVSWYLTYSSVVVLETTCQWCLGSATAMTAIGILSYIAFVRARFL